MTPRAEIADLADAFRVTLSPDTVRIYEEHLSDIPPEHLHDAAVAARAELDRFPSIAWLRRYAVEAMYGAALPEPAAAWERVMAWSTNPKEHPLSELERRVVTGFGGGWTFRTSENLDVLRGQFRMAYTEAREAERRKLQTGKLDRVHQHMQIEQ